MNLGSRAIFLTLGSVLEAHVQHCVVQRSSHQELETEVVNTLRVAVGLALLGLVPVEDQAITEGKASCRIGSLLVAIEHASGESRLDMANDFLFETLGIVEWMGLVSLPSLTLRLWD